MPRDARAEKIEEAAYKVLKEKGFKGASMLAVARAAKASNETLYKWYGDKTGLFSALIERNSAQVTEQLERLRGSGQTGLAALEELGEALLTMLTGERAVALNRAAAADMTGTLGAAIAKGGREAVLPLLADLVREAQANGNLGTADLHEISETYVALLVGDMQIRRAIGSLDAPSGGYITARASRAVIQLQRLYPA